MDSSRFGAMTRRRVASIVGDLAVTFSVLSRSESVAARPQLCRKNGKKCSNESDRCQARFCLHAPFRIDLEWGNTSSVAAYLLPPKKNKQADPTPYLNFACNAANSDCETAYPFACVNEPENHDANEEGTTRIHKLLDGKYQYWVQLPANAQPDLATVRLRNKNGKVMRTFKSIANPNGSERGWHVFDFDGRDGTVKAINQLGGAQLPTVASPNLNFVCPV